MDEVEREIIKATVDAAAAPMTKVVSDLIGVAGGDALSDYRDRLKELRQARHKKNSEDVLRETQRLLTARGIVVDAATASEHVEQILDAAADVSHPEIKALFARLLAAAVDPKLRSRFRRDYIDIVKQMEPIDALVFPLLETRNDLAPHRLGYVANYCDRGPDEIFVSFENLHRLGLLDGFQTPASTHAPGLSPKGRQFLSVVGG